MKTAMVGTMLGTMLALFGYAAIQTWKNYLPATAWMEITEFHVDDAQPGDDPRITYARTFKADVSGTWAVNVLRYRNDKDLLGTIYCAGSGVATYKKDRDLPPTATKLSWLMRREGRECYFEPGIYRAVVTVILSPDGYPTKVVERESNYFLVPPGKDEQP